MPKNILLHTGALFKIARFFACMYKEITFQHHLNFSTNNTPGISLNKIAGVILKKKFHCRGKRSEIISKKKVPYEKDV